MNRLPLIAKTLLATAATLGVLAGLFLPATGAAASDAVEDYLTPSPNPSPSIYVPVYPKEPATPALPELPDLTQPPVFPTKQPPSLEGRLAGIDVSHWNHDIDWQRVAGDGISFAIAKATEGGTFKDSRYQENREGAKEAGIVFGAYEYARPTTRTNDAERDARHFLDVAQLTDDDLVPVLDLEETGGLNKDQLRRWVDAWTEEVHGQTGVWPMIYVSSSFWAHPMGNTNDHAALGHPLWVAHWHVSTPRVPGQMWNNRDWTVWQWTSDGSVKGIEGRVDMNVYNGTDLAPLTIGVARANQTAVAPLPAPPKPPRSGGSDGSEESGEDLPIPGLEFLEDILF